MKLTNDDLEKTNATIFGRFLEFVQADDRPDLNTVESLQLMLFVLLMTCKPNSYGGAGAKELILENFDESFPDEGHAVLELLFKSRELDGAKILSLESRAGGKILFLPKTVVELCLAEGNEWLAKMLGNDTNET